MNRKILESILRVDHAGEYGAVQIYKGQKAFLKRRETNKILDTMLDQEKEHLAYFEEKLKHEKIKPTVFLPLWKIMGFGMGAASALLGRRAAMACTSAVEEVIEDHYQDQINQLEEGELKETLIAFRQEEIEHKELGYHMHAESAPFYPLLRTFIRGSTKLAIFLSKRC